jgi:hypothetical protein
MDRPEPTSPAPRGLSYLAQGLSFAGGAALGTASWFLLFADRDDVHELAW